MTYIDRENLFLGISNTKDCHKIKCMTECHKRVDAAYGAVKAENNTWLSIGKTWQSAM